MSNDTFSDPASATGIEWKDLKGSLLLVRPRGFEPAIKTVHGDSPAVQGDVIVLDGDKEGEEFLDTLIFPKVLISQVKPKIGPTGMVLGRLGQGQKKPGQSPPWMLSAATEEDRKVGLAYLEKNKGDVPF